MLHRVAAVCFALRLPLFEITRVLVRIDHAAFSILKWFLTPVVDMFGICTGPLTSLRTRSSLPPLLPDHLAAGDSIYLNARRGCSPYPRLPCNTVSKVSGQNRGPTSSAVGMVEPVQSRSQFERLLWTAAAEPSRFLGDRIICWRFWLRQRSGRSVDHRAKSPRLRLLMSRKIAW